MVCLLLPERIPRQIIFTIEGNPLSFPIVSHDSTMFAAVACRLFTAPVAVVKFASIEPLVLQIVLVIPQAHPASSAVVNGIDRSINKELCFLVTENATKETHELANSSPMNFPIWRLKKRKDSGEEVDNLAEMGLSIARVFLFTCFAPKFPQMP